MVDITVVGIYSLVSSVLGTGAHMLTYRKINAIQKALKIQRIELTSVEILTVLSLGVQGFENYLWKKEFQRAKETANLTTANLTMRINELSDRVNAINLTTIDAKLDKVLESTSNTPTAEPVVVTEDK